MPAISASSASSPPRAAACSTSLPSLLSRPVPSVHGGPIGAAVVSLDYPHLALTSLDMATGNLNGPPRAHCTRVAQMHVNMEELEAGTLILYKTNESENGLKLGVIVDSHSEEVCESEANVFTSSVYQLGLRVSW